MDAFSFTTPQRHGSFVVPMWSSSKLRYGRFDAVTCGDRLSCDIGGIDRHVLTFSLIRSNLLVHPTPLSVRPSHKGAGHDVWWLVAIGQTSVRVLPLCHVVRSLPSDVSRTRHHMRRRRPMFNVQGRLQSNLRYSQSMKHTSASSPSRRQNIHM